MFRGVYDVVFLRLCSRDICCAMFVFVRAILSRCPSKLDRVVWSATFFHLNIFSIYILGVHIHVHWIYERIRCAYFVRTCIKCIPSMYSSPTVRLQYMVNFNPLHRGYDCQVTIWHSKHKRNELRLCDKPYLTNKRKVQKGERIEVLRN